MNITLSAKMLCLAFIGTFSLSPSFTYAMNRQNARRLVATACNAGTLYYTGKDLLKSGLQGIQQTADEIRNPSESNVDPDIEQFVREAIAPCNPRRHVAIRASNKYTTTYNQLRVDAPGLRVALDADKHYPQYVENIAIQERAIAHNRAILAYHQNQSNQSRLPKYLQHTARQGQVNVLKGLIQGADAELAAKKEALKAMRTAIDLALNDHRGSMQHEVAGHINHNDLIKRSLAALSLPIATTLASRLCITSLLRYAVKSPIIADVVALPIRIAAGQPTNPATFGAYVRYQEQRADEHIINDQAILEAQAHIYLQNAQAQEKADRDSAHNPEYQFKKALKEWEHPTPLARGRRFAERAAHLREQEKKAAEHAQITQEGNSPQA